MFYAIFVSEKGIKMKKLLTRNGFREATFNRDSHKCVVCGNTKDLAAHHILDRSLFEDGGYYVDNGATLCPDCHIQAENSMLTCEEIRELANVAEVILPPNFNISMQVDKWGNEIVDKLMKYPSTRHIEGSGLQKGDSDDLVPFSDLEGKYLVSEEKIDGANSGISFSDDCELLLQCRGHYLTGKGDWPQFDQFKVWANTFKEQLFDTLSDRYIMYGEWMSAFHSIYYDLLPHFFMEFDIYDKKEKVFLDTNRRREIIEKSDVIIEPVRVLKKGVFESKEDLMSLIGKSAFVSDNAYNDLSKVLKEKNIPEEQRKFLLNLNDRIMEGIYVKWEEDGIVKGRYKFVRSCFVQTILSSGKHWAKRPHISNKLKDGFTLFDIGRRK